MLAITISCSDGDRHARCRVYVTTSLCASYLAIAAFSLVLLLALASASTLAQTPASEQSARAIYKVAQAEFQKAQTNATAAWKFGRAAYDLADLVQDNQERQQAAQAGIDACRRAAAIDPQSAPAQYYLALNLGELARTKKLGALKLLHEMEHALLKAAQLDSVFDYAGPDRSLGMLYLEAPSWPASVGNRNKARAHLESAVQISGDFPENHIALAEAYSAWSEVRNLERELQRLEELWPAAKTKFAGEPWAATWKDWQSRLQKLQKSRDRLLATPRYSPAERGAVKAK
jgi:hypothetical protein